MHATRSTSHVSHITHKSGHLSVVPYQAFTQDIYIVVAVFVEKFWRTFCRVLGIEELIDDPRFCNDDHRRDNREKLVPILEEIFCTRPGGEWLRPLSEAQVLCGPINTLDRLFADPQVVARNMVVEAAILFTAEDSKCMNLPSLTMSPTG